MEVELTKREKEVLNTNISAEIMKLQYRYKGNGSLAEEVDVERLQTLYSLRDKLCAKESK